MNIRFINSPEKREILAQLENQFGITELPYLLFEAGKDKIRGYSGSLSKEEIVKLSTLLNIEIIGIYMIRNDKSARLMRLSLDGSHLLSKYATKNIIEISEEQKESWLRGNDLEFETAEHGVVLVKNKNNFFGCGLSTGKKILNCVPKERRIRFSAEKYKIRDKN